MINTLLFIHLVIALLLIMVVLLQKTSTDGLSGIGGGGNNMGLVSGRSAASFMSRTTVILATLFFINAIILANLSSRPAISTDTKMEKHQDNGESNQESEKSLPMAK